MAIYTRVFTNFLGVLVYCIWTLIRCFNSNLNCGYIKFTSNLLRGETCRCLEVCTLRYHAFYTCAPSTLPHSAPTAILTKISGGAHSERIVLDQPQYCWCRTNRSGCSVLNRLHTINGTQLLCKELFFVFYPYDPDEVALQFVASVTLKTLNKSLEPL
jgi:hypothetical protein